MTPDEGSMIKKHSAIFSTFALRIFLLCPVMAMPLCIAYGENGKSAGNGNSLHHVYIPPGYLLSSAKKIEFIQGSLHIRFFSREFSQGDAVYVEIVNSEKDESGAASINFYYDGIPVPVSRADWGFRGFFGISPEAKPGKKNVSITYSANGGMMTLARTIDIIKSSFPVFTTPLDLGKFSDTRKRTDKEITFINESDIKKKKAFGSRGPDRIGSIMSHPRDIHYITSSFWSTRRYMQYAVKNGTKVNVRTTSSIHKGLDLRGETGNPVYALAGGTIALAEELYYEGYMVIIDHGNNIFSYYMHMNDVKVKKDDPVNGGDLIGHVGSTGQSTAAHLHVSLIISGAQINPLTLLHLPVRDLVQARNDNGGRQK